MDRRLLPFALALLACNDVPQDDFVSQGGISPDPTAILEGSVLYTGPPPRCVYRDGAPERVLGRVALTMFEYDNPPPPEGSASSALNLMFVEGLFSTRDCLPDGVTTSDQRITRSVAFRWPRVTLLASAASYQIRGFYDYDEDMIPLFSVSRLPTAGDVIGAALNDVRDPSKGLLRIALPPTEEAEDGLIYGGITIALAEVVRTERPAFQLDANRTLSSAQPFIPALGAMGLDAAGSLRVFRANTCATPGTAGCGLSIQPLPSDLAPTLAASGVSIDLADPVASAFYSAPIDIKTVQRKSETNLGVDTPVPDGKVDPHPILGAALGIPWYTPAVLLQRLPIPGAELHEATARIPRVLFVASPLLNDDLTPIASSFVDSAIPPLGPRGARLRRRGIPTTWQTPFVAPIYHLPPAAGLMPAEGTTTGGRPSSARPARAAARTTPVTRTFRPRAGWRWSRRGRSACTTRWTTRSAACSSSREATAAAPCRSAASTARSAYRACRKSAPRRPRR